MRRLSTASAVVLGCLLASGVAAAQDFDAAGEQQMLARINAMRAAQQLGPLARHDGLDAAARAHSQDMAAQNALTHVSPTTGTPADRVRRAGVSATTIAENVALHRSAEDAHQALLGSDAHRANMMSPDITHVGLAALRTDRGVYVTQVFAAIGAPAPPAVAAAPPVAAPAAPAAPAVAAPVAPTAPAVAAPSAPAIAAPSQAPPAAPAAPGEQDCFSPLPGVRICGRLPAPSVEPPAAAAPVAPVAPAPIAPAPVAPAPVAPAPAAPAPSPARLVVQPGTNGTVIHAHAADGRVEGYWVYGSGRWWYYPMPPGAQPGQQLQPDLRVSGPPPGFPEHPFGPPRGPQPVAPRPHAWQAAPPPPPPVASPVILDPRAGQLTVAPGTTFYAVPPPPMMGTPDRAWRRSHAQWSRAYRRWLRDQTRLRRRAL